MAILSCITSWFLPRLALSVCGELGGVSATLGAGAKGVKAAGPPLGSS